MERGIILDRTRRELTIRLPKDSRVGHDKIRRGNTLVGGSKSRAQ